MHLFNFSWHLRHVRMGSLARCKATLPSADKVAHMAHGFLPNSLFPAVRPGVLSQPAPALGRHVPVQGTQQ